MAVRVVTDSSADLPPSLAESHGITVVPTYVIINDQTFKDGVDITADDFYAQLGTMARLPTTAQPSAADFQEVYARCLEQGDQILSVHVSGKLSGTLNSAQQAKAALGDDGSIEIVDSRLASIPLGLAALDAARAAEAGKDVHEIASELRQSLHLHHGFFALDTLEYLQKGGRIGKAQAFLGSMLSVKPILTLSDGEAHPLERPRNRDRAQRRLIELVRNLGPLRQIAVIHSTSPERSSAVKAELAGILPGDQVIETRFGATLGVYLGPNALGIAATRQG